VWKVAGVSPASSAGDDRAGSGAKREAWWEKLVYLDMSCESMVASRRTVSKMLPGRVAQEDTKTSLRGSGVADGAGELRGRSGEDRGSAF
jgi:hypothetical protein